MRSAVLAALAAAAPSSLSACPMCFGAAQSNVRLASAFSIAIVILIGVVFSLLGGIGATVYNIEKRRAAALRAGKPKSDGKVRPPLEESLKP